MSLLIYQFHFSLSSFSHFNSTRSVMSFSFLFLFTLLFFLNYLSSFFSFHFFFFFSLLIFLSTLSTSLSFLSTSLFLFTFFLYSFSFLFLPQFLSFTPLHFYLPHLPFSLTSSILSSSPPFIFSFSLFISPTFTNKALLYLTQGLQ